MFLTPHRSILSSTACRLPAEPDESASSCLFHALADAPMNPPPKSGRSSGRRRDPASRHPACHNRLPPRWRSEFGLMTGKAGSGCWVAGVWKTTNMAVADVGLRSVGAAGEIARLKSANVAFGRANKTCQWTDILKQEGWCWSVTAHRGVHACTLFTGVPGLSDYVKSSGAGHGVDVGLWPVWVPTYFGPRRLIGETGGKGPEVSFHYRNGEREKRERLDHWLAVCILKY